MENKILKEWLLSSKLNDQEKKVISEMNLEEQKNFFSSEHLKFGTAGVRAIMGLGTNRLNQFVYEQLTEGYCKWLLSKTKNPKIIIARDNRKNGSFFQKTCAKVASSFGIEVNLIKGDRIKATPIVSFLIKEMKLDGAIIITASHNPKNYNGFKIYKDNGGQLIDSETKIVEDFMPSNESIIKNEYIKNDFLIKEIDEKYESKYLIAARDVLIKTNINELKEFPIIFTPHHGTSVDTMEEWLKSIGYNNVILVKEQGYISSDFENSLSSNPEDKDSFQISLKYAKENNAKIMLGVDPDADRLAIVVMHNNEWYYLSGNESGIIFTEYVINNKKFTKKPMVVSTHVSTILSEIICKKNNISYFKTGTGFKWISDKINKELKNHELVVAFEEAIGSLNTTINSDKDSFQGAALILEIFNECSKNNKTLIDYLDEIYEKYGYWKGATIAFLMDAVKILDWKTKMISKMEFFQKVIPKSINGTNFLNTNWNHEGDCLEWKFENGSVIKFRMSGTEPKFKSYINALGDSQNSTKNFIKEATEYINELYYSS